MIFKRINNNPKGKNTTDCTVRAIASALKITWEDALMQLTKNAIKTGYFTNSSLNIDDYLKSLDYVETKVKGKRKLKDMRFTKPHIVVLKTPGRLHLTYVDEGNVLIDSWDCRNNYVIKYFTL